MKCTPSNSNVTETTTSFNIVEKETYEKANHEKMPIVCHEPLYIYMPREKSPKLTQQASPVLAPRLACAEAPECAKHETTH